ncbi:hypothetical protein KC315_g5639 [Hortaea werneckii]|nr:hypothetical protein KC315_g5639 [Hortaea werneckii]
MNTYDDLSHVPVNALDGKLIVDVVTADRNPSQFWYTDATASVYVEQLLGGATSHSSIAIVPTPSVRFDRIICDTIFLSHNRQTRIAMTIRYLARSRPVHTVYDIMGYSVLRSIPGTGAVTASMNEKLWSRR